MADEKRDLLAEAIAASYEPEPQPGPINPNYLTERAYATWVPVATALKQLAPIGHVNYIKEEIWRRLKSGLLRSVAQINRWEKQFGGYEERRFEILSEHLWAINKEPEDYAALWRTGTHTMQARDDSRSRLLDTDSFGIRFDPEGINQILIDAGAAPVELGAGSPPTQPGVVTGVTRRQDLPRLPDTIAEAWMTWFKGQPNATKDRAEQSALLMFPNHNLSRDRIRDLFGAAKMGRPSKTDD